MSAPLLRLAGLNQAYGQSHILHDIALDVPQGSCTCVMGRNGVGKTTLMRAIMGQLPIRSGQILFAGANLAGQPAHERARRAIGFVPQGREIFPRLSVEENLQLGLPAARTRGRGIPGRIYELFPVLHEMRQRRGGDLSGGQQQQLAIGRALVLRPRLLILDEPTEGIQPNIVADIGRIIRRLNQEEGLTVLLVEQKLAFARMLAERFYLMERGAVVQAGPIAALSEAMVHEHLHV